MRLLSNTSEGQSRDFRSYMSNRLMGTKSPVSQQFLSLSYTLSKSTDIEKEFQRKVTMRTCEASDDRHRVTSSDFERY